MKRQLRPLLLLLSSLLVLAQAPPIEIAKPSGPTATAIAFLDLMVKGEYQTAVQNFTDAMKAAAPPPRLAEIWSTLQSQMGPYKRRLATRTVKQGLYDVVLATTEFGGSTVDLKVVVDERGRIAGFFVVPAAQEETPAPADPGPPPYAKQDAFREREVTVGSGEWAVPGTLATPVGQGPFPAVVLVHGSGPNDRDETVGGAKPFRDLAWGLASRGVAVLRYEKRTRQHGAKLAAVSGFTVQQETIDDALAAAALLRGTEGIDPGRVYVLGHSLGAMLVPRIGWQEAKIAGFIVMAGAAKPIEDLILDQVTYIAALDGINSDEEKRQIEGLREQVAKVKALQPGATESVLGAPASYWLDLRGYSPPEAARALKQPLLILQGERDYQVTVDNFEAWKKALAGRSDVTFKLYPGLNHLFIAGEGKSGPAEYQRPGHVAEVVVADIAAWVVSPHR
jgi:dienelactone hydrolase